jgi:hypothetical protein
MLSHGHHHPPILTFFSSSTRARLVLSESVAGVVAARLLLAVGRTCAVDCGVGSGDGVGSGLASVPGLVPPCEIHTTFLICKRNHREASGRKVREG